MSAVEELVRSYNDSIGVGECEITDNARAELAALLARVEELERERDAARSGHDYAVAEQAKSTAYITELLMDKVTLSLRVAELEQRRTFDAGVIDGLNVAIKIKDERLAELESAQSATVTPAPRDTLNKVWMHVVRLYVPLSYNNSGDVCEVIIGGDDMIGIQDAAEVIKQSLTQAIVTPRKCVTCKKLAEQMREEAAKFADDFDGEDLGFDVPTSIGAGIRALPLPTCGTCNQLAPKPQSQASLSDQLRELVQLANANGLYDAADYIRRED